MLKRKKKLIIFFSVLLLIVISIFIALQYENYKKINEVRDFVTSYLDLWMEDDLKKNADAIIDRIYFKPGNEIFNAEQLSADISEYLTPTKEYKILDIKLVSNDLYYINTYQFNERLKKTTYVNYVKKIDGKLYYIINIRDLDEEDVKILESKSLLPPQDPDMLMDENTQIFDFKNEPK